MWLRLVRAGNVFTAYYSTDGVAWTQNGPTQTIPMGASVNVGLAVDAYNTTSLDTAMYRYVSIVPGGWSDADVGSPGAAGSGSFDPASSTWTLNGGGSDIWGSADQFNFASQHLVGNGSVTARVTSLSNTNAWAKAGVMLRNDGTASAAFANVDVTPGNGVTFQWRTSACAAAASVTIGGLVAPVWVKLSRYANAFSAYYSSDGQAWTPIGTAQTISISANALAGLAVSAHDDAALTEATFTNAAVAAAACAGGRRRAVDLLQQQFLRQPGQRLQR